MNALLVQHVRGDTVESTHRVSVAVTNAEGGLVARAGDPQLVVFLRSAAKPFQAAPLIEDGVADRFGITTRELALACASHNSEPEHVALAQAMLRRIGCSEADLACGPHKPLWQELATLDSRGATIAAVPQTPVASNCAGKHAGMLALAKHHGWDVAGYHRSDHPVQQRMKREVARFTATAEREIPEAVDGCGVVTYAVPLDRLARGYARLVTSEDPALRTVTGAMTAHPFIVGGTGRLCTELMGAFPTVLAKVGAGGLYAAALRDRGLGIALKVEDGLGQAASVALLAVLGRLGVDPPPAARLARFARPPIVNTRQETVGLMHAVGEIEFV